VLTSIYRPIGGLVHQTLWAMGLRRKYCEACPSRCPDVEFSRVRMQEKLLSQAFVDRNLQQLPNCFSVPVRKWSSGSKKSLTTEGGAKY
jgi:hypothetical protein